MARIGTTFADAALLGRRAVDVELDERWVTLSTENLDHMLDGPSCRLAECRGMQVPDSDAAWSEGGANDRV